MRRPSERIPATPDAFEPWLNALYVQYRPWERFTLDTIFLPPACGRKFYDLLDKELTDIRNDIAHALTASGDENALSADESLHLTRVEEWLPLLRCIVRRMLKNDFPSQFLPTLREDGTIDAEKAIALSRVLGPDVSLDMRPGLDAQR